MMQRVTDDNKAASLWAARKLGPAPSSSPLKDVGLKSFALLAKHAPKGDDAASLRSNATSAGKVADALGVLPPLALWKDWSALKSAPSKEITASLEGKNAFASSKKSEDCAASKALEVTGSTSSCWTSASGGSSKQWHWGIGFGRVVRLSAITVELKSPQVPETVELEVASSLDVPASQGSKAEFKTTGKKLTGKELAKGGSVTLGFGGQGQGQSFVSCSHLRLALSGQPSANTDGCVSIGRVRVWEEAEQDEGVTAAAALNQLLAWLVGIASTAASVITASAGSSSTAPSTAIATTTAAAESAYGAAVRALIGLARASGSLRALLSLARVLLVTPHPSAGLSSSSSSSLRLPPAACRSGLSLLQALASVCEVERAYQCYREYFPLSALDKGAGGLLMAAQREAEASASSISRVAGFSLASSSLLSSSSLSSSLARLESAVWDKDCCSSGVTLAEENKSVRSGDGTYNYCLMSLGEDFAGGPSSGFTSGKASWELKLVEDTDSQCSCFGMSTKPVSSANYDSGASFWMYRSYNGYRYARGSTIHSSNSTRVYKGNTVRFDLDFDDGSDGTCRMTINGADQGVVFTGLRGKEVWPAVTFYGTGRVVNILSVMGPSKSRGMAARGASAAAAARGIRGLGAMMLRGQLPGSSGGDGATSSSAAAGAVRGAASTGAHASALLSPAPPVPLPEISGSADAAPALFASLDLDGASSSSSSSSARALDRALASQAAILAADSIITAPAAFVDASQGSGATNAGPGADGSSSSSVSSHCLSSALSSAARAAGLIDPSTGAPLESAVAFSSQVGFAASHYLSDLREHHSSGIAQAAALGRNGDLGYHPATVAAAATAAAAAASSSSSSSSASNDPQQRKVKVAGTAGFEHALSMLPAPALPSATSSASSSSSAAPLSLIAEAEEALTAADGARSSTAPPEGSQEDHDSRRERLLREAQTETKTGRAFKEGSGAASAVFWLGKRYESLSGACSLNDSATPELRALNDASPVFFEIYGDSRLLWRSQPVHASKAPPQAFAVRMLGVEVLRLVVRCLGGNAGAHAVWLDPRLTVVTEWCLDGWRNDREAFADDISGTKRGAVPPLPAPEEVVADLKGHAAAIGHAGEGGGSDNDDASSDGEDGDGAEPLARNAFLRRAARTPHGLATSLLCYAGLLAREHLKGLRNATIHVGPLSTSTSSAIASEGQTVAPQVEAVEAPFCLEPSGASIQELASLLSLLLSSTSASVSTASTINILTANLKKAAACRLNPLALGLSVPASTGAASLALAPTLATLADSLYRSASWGGDADGKKLVPSPAGDAAAAPSPSQLKSGSQDPAVQAAIWELLDLAAATLSVAAGKDNTNSRHERLRLLRAVAGGPGTVELQLQWPCDEGDSDGALVQLETMLLQTQLWAAENHARCRLFGKWPARVYLVIEVGAASGAGSSAAPGVKEWLDGPFTSMLASLDLKGWWWAEAAAASNASSAPSPSPAMASGSEIFPVKLERDPMWNRRERGVVEGGLGAIRVYPAYAASFEAVCEGLEGFLPKQ